MLQYNCPVHSTWNIVHIGSLLPESHAIYVCGDNCLRGVVMTAAEMGLTPRFSAVMPTEAEISDGRLEEVTIRGTADLIRKLPYRPKAVLLFLVCMHHFVGADENYIFRELEREFPDIFFLRCWMDPAMQKLGPSPDMKLRREMLSPLKAGRQPEESEDPVQKPFAALVSDNIPLPEDSTLARFLRELGIPYRQPQDCRAFSDYQFLGKASLFLTRSPAAAFGLRKFTAEEKKEGLYLPVKLGYEDIREILRELMEKLLYSGLLQTPVPGKTAVRQRSAGDESLAAAGTVEHWSAWLTDFCRKEEAACEAAFAALPDFLYRAEISLDGVGIAQPLSAARFLLSHGLPVKRIYLDAPLSEEAGDLQWLQEHAPSVEILSVSDVRAFNRARTGAEQRRRQTAGNEGAGNASASHPLRLALGPVAAFYEDTPHFIYQIENRGAWGYQAVRQLLQDMTAACAAEKNPEELLPRKGWGLPSLVEKLS